jgi:hypothetical protein
MKKSGGIGKAVLLCVGVTLILIGLMACSPTYYTPSPEDGDIYLTWAAANIRAQHAQETAAALNALVTRQAQQTRTAQEQFFFQVTQTAVAWNMENQRANATATARAIATATADWHARATATAQAAATATAIGYANATATASSAATATATAEHATATAVAPTVAIVQARTETELRREEWRQRTAPAEHILRVVFWAVLVLVGIASLLWLIPRAYHALMMRFLALRSGAPDKPLILAPASDGFWTAWVRPPRLTAYDADRAGGPGLFIDLATGEAKELPGGDPDTTRRDQGIDAGARLAAAAGRLPPGAAAKTAREIQAPPPYRILPPSETPPPPIAAALPVLDAQWREEEGEGE